MRVSGGRLVNRRLRVPRGDVRPTADRVRESLFASLGDLTGARVLDLFAGSGALGIEALSRGAANAVFVENAAGVVATLRANLEALELEDCSTLQRADARVALKRLAARGDCFDLILLDPPYASDLVDQALCEVARLELLDPAGVVVAETDRRHPPGETAGLAPARERRYGDTLLTHFARCDPREPGGKLPR